MLSIEASQKSVQKIGPPRNIPITPKRWAPPKIMLAKPTSRVIPAAARAVSATDHTLAKGSSPSPATDHKRAQLESDVQGAEFPEILMGEKARSTA